MKQSKVAEVAMESMQKQLLELQRSDALQRAREQHDAIISALKQKHEKQVLSLEQNLDATKSALREQVRNYYRTLSALQQKLQNSTLLVADAEEALFYWGKQEFSVLVSLLSFHSVTNLFLNWLPRNLSRKEKN